MSNFDKNKDNRRKKFYSSQRDRDNPSYNVRGRSIYKHERENRDSDRYSSEAKEKTMPQPTILLKNRDTNTTRTVSPKRTTSTSKEPDTQNAQPTLIQKPKQPAPSLSSTLWSSPSMNHCVSLIDEDFTFNEDILEHFSDQYSDFLVVGILGTQGAGKSSILNWLAKDRLVKDKENKSTTSALDSEPEKDFISVKSIIASISSLSVDKASSANSVNKQYPNVFKVESLSEIERGINCTKGVNVHIDSNRVIIDSGVLCDVIYLDSQPILSLGILDKMVQTGSTATTAGETILTENSSEIQSLQLAAFFMTVCHVVIMVQDWFFDPNIIRFLQTAEMLKPSIMSTSEEELNEHFPHVILLHNKATIEDFNPLQFNIMQNIYRNMFKQSKLRLETGLGIAGGTILESLCPTTCGNPLNIYLLPEISDEDESACSSTQYRGRPKSEDLIENFKRQILGASRSPLTHTQLSEKTWLHYASKVWDVVMKSSFFVEYNKLLP